MSDGTHPFLDKEKQQIRARERVKSGVCVLLIQFGRKKIKERYLNGVLILFKLNVLVSIAVFLEKIKAIIPVSTETIVPASRKNLENSPQTSQLKFVVRSAGNLVIQGITNSITDQTVKHIIIYDDHHILLPHRMVPVD